MTYAVKEIFLTLQGEGMQAGRRAVFLRLSGCNLWTGREQDRAEAACNFCDTDFVGMDGENGGRYEAQALAGRVAALWGDAERPLVVITGGEPMLQLDAALIDALHARGFEIAVETNGTLPAPEGIDWICVSPKAGTEVVQRGRRTEAGLAAGGDRSGGAARLGFPPLPDPADGLRRRRSRAHGRDRLCAGPSAMAAGAADPQIAGFALRPSAAARTPAARSSAGSRNRAGRGRSG